MKQTVAWACCAFCVWFSAQTASVFCKSHPRHFTVMALFALVWALLLPYYSVSSDFQYRELFAAYGGFILVYIGGQLTLEAAKEKDTIENVSLIQRLGMLLFFPLAFASAPKIDLPNFQFQLSREQSQNLITTLMDICGYCSIWYGTHKLSGLRASKLLGMILALYSASEAFFTVWSFWEKTWEIPDFLSYIFDLLKIGLTLVFGYIVSSDTIVDEGIGNWLLCVIKLRDPQKR